MTDIPKTIGLVDFSHGLTVHYKARANDAGPNDAGQAFINQLSEFRSMCGKVILCLDKGPYWRKEVFPGYKAGREREAEYGPIYAWTLERVQKDGYQTAFATGEEGDDVIATLALAYQELGCRDVRIFGADKDTFQCVNESVRVFVPVGGGQFSIRDATWVKKKAFNIDWEQEKIEGIWPKDVALAIAINGDTSDKIPGVKGIGWKGAAKLINNYKDLSGMANACAGAIEAAKMTDKPPAAFWKNYAAGMAELPKWLKLTTLNDHAALNKTPREFLEVLPVQQLVSTDDDLERDAIQAEGEFVDEAEFVDAPTAEELEEERRTMAAALPVGPAPDPGDELLERVRKISEEDPIPSNMAEVVARDESKAKTARPAPIVGVAPDAKEQLERAARERQVARMNTSPKGATPTEAEIDATQKAIREGNEAERARNRHGVVTPDPTVMDGPKSAAGAPAATPPVAAAASVVPPTQGPPRQRSNGIDEPGVTSLVVAPPNWALAAQPRTVSEMMQTAKFLVNSRAHSAYGTPEAVMNAMALGRELGLGFATSLDSFHLYNNKPLLKAVTYKALAERHPDCVWIVIVSADDTQATMKTNHRELGILEYQYTADRARKAGYFTGGNKENWNNKTQEMLEARATTKSIRRWYAGVMIGQRSYEEEQDGES